MTKLTPYFFPIVLLAAPLAVQAQDWNRAPREVFWDGNCRVEQFLTRDGDIVERRRCRGDGNAYARAAREDDDRPEPRRYADPPRYGQLVPQPGSYAAARMAPRYEPAPAPLPAPAYRVAEPVSLVPHIIPKSAPAPVAVQTRVVAKAAPPVAAPAPRIVARAAAPRPAARAAVAPPPRIAARAAPPAAARVPTKAALAPRLVARAAPAPAPRALAKPTLMARAARLFGKTPPAAPQRIAARAPAAVAPRAAARVAPQPVRLAERAAPAVAAPRVIAKAQPVARPVRAIARVEPAPAPRAIAKMAPAPEAPRVAAKAEVVGKTSGNYPKADWLVTLPSTDTEKAEAVVKAPLAAAAKAPAAPKPLVATVEPDWQRHEYREYVVAKSKDRYSNLK